jgi:hypothetical protein
MTTKTKAKVSSRRELPAAREIDMPPRDYQPTKAETEREYDMPAADIVTVRRAFFRPVRVRETSPK